MMINLNDKVRVKLTDKGRRIMRQNREELRKICPTLPKEPYVNDVGNGWSEWQLWCLMQEFGEHISMGLMPPFETTIEVVETADERGGAHFNKWAAR